MRLTLRTLLAYLDDILEPSQTKEIGAKLTDSKFATGLVDRIREVIRRRRLTAPDIHGKGANDDPNVVAEYLDNTLSPDKVAEFERICLESDVQLAEAAACHQILTLVLGEPVEIRSESRRRMYTLVGEHQAAEAAAKAKSDGAPAAEDAAIAEEEQPLTSRAAGSTGEEAESFNKRIPEYLRPRPFWQRALAPVIIFTLLGLAVMLAITDEDFRTMLGGFVSPSESEEVVADADSGKGASDVAEEKPSVESPVGEPGPTGDMIASTEDAAPDSTMDATSPADDTGSAPEAVATNTTPSETAKPEMKTPTEAASPSVVSDDSPVTTTAPAAPDQGEETTSTGEPRGPVIASLPGPDAPAKGQTPTPPQPMVNETPPVVAPDIRDVSSGQSVLLHFDVKKDGWYVVSRKLIDPATDRKISPDELIASPEPFDSHIDVGQGSCQLLLRGGTSLRLLGPTAAGPFGLEVLKGRVVISSGTSVGDDALKAKPMQFGVLVRGELRRVELARAGTVCGIEVVPGQPEKLDQDLATVGYDAKLHLASGGLRLQDPSGKVQTLFDLGWLSLSPQAAASDADASIEQVNRALAEFTTSGKGSAGTNRWLHTQPLPPSSYTARKLTTQFLREFDEDQPLRLSIAPVARDGNPLISEMAVKTLALVEDYPSLVKTLAEVSHEEALNAAINGLRDWLPVSPNNAGLLKAELARVFRPDTAEIVYRLLWGYGKSDAEDRDVSLQLVNWLEHDELAVRQLAFYHIQRLTGQKHRYQADLSPLQRTTIVSRLRASVEKTGGLIRKNGSKEPE